MPGEPFSIRPATPSASAATTADRATAIARSGRLERLGAHLQSIVEAVKRCGISCAWERTGSMAVATEPHQIGS